MLKMSNEVKVGITVLLAFLVAIVGFRFMRDVPIFRQTLEISTTFDRGDGISQGSTVNVKGVKVGSVRTVRLTPENRVRVTMRLDGTTQIPKGSVAQLTSLGIVEGKSVVIQLGDSDEMVEFGDEIEGVYVESITEVLGSRGDEIAGDVSESLSELNIFLRQLNATFDDDARTSLDETLMNASKATQQIASILEDKQDDIDRAISSGTRMLSQLDTLATDNRARVDSIMTSLEKNINELEGLRLEMESATSNLNVILEKINNGDGTLGKLVNDPSMYDNLDELAIEIKNLVKGINENPGRYLRHMSIIDIF
ncbi:MAG: MCE family protein [Balneolaceae bacterium]|nr:MAG: MCE family protein [Balneolaceae bacterium]